MRSGTFVCLKTQILAWEVVKLWKHANHVIKANCAILRSRWEITFNNIKLEKYVFPSRCTQCDKRFSRGSNAKYHIQQVHEKNMERKIDQEFFDRNKGLFEDYALTDPNYPTSEIVRAKIEEARKKFKY